MAADVPMLREIALGVRARLEEVEPVAATAEARPLATRTPAQHYRLLWLPPGSVARVEPDPDLAAAERVVRVDLDRQSEHRRDPERVDRAHRLHPALAVDQHLVPTRLGRERIRHQRAAVRIDVDKVLA